MRKPVTFRPIKQDDEALDAIAMDHPAIANSMTKMIRKALEEYVKRGSTEARFRRIEARLDRIEAK